jgi:hypothetical protein
MTGYRFIFKTVPEFCFLENSKYVIINFSFS